MMVHLQKVQATQGGKEIEKATSCTLSRRIVYNLYTRFEFERDRTKPVQLHRMSSSKGTAGSMESSVAGADTGNSPINSSMS